MNTRRAAIRSLLFACTALGGCAAADPTEDARKGEDAILGGIPAKSTKFDAIGMLYGVKSSGPAPICTGTLIGPHTVLTAGHCVHPTGAPFNIIDKFPVYFAIGYDSAHPAQTIRAVWGGTTPLANQDIGIYELAEDPAGITPMPIADSVLTDDDLGDKFTFAGFGLQDESETFTAFLTRRAGRLELTTFDAQPLHELFPDFQVFKAMMEANAGHTFTDDQAKLVYDDVLVHAGDAFLGRPGEPQPVYLDSGEPVLRVDGANGLRIHGVNVRGYRSDPTVPTTGTAADLLPVGTAIAMIGVAETTAFIQQTLSDPCSMLSPGGQCSATTAVRCGNELNPPVISVVECADFGAVCKVDSSGQAACVDP